jgi:hypothetical protein
MRNLQRNQRELYYAVPTGTEPILDEYGNDTLQVRTVYGAPVIMRGNVSANVGQEAVAAFGSQTDYSRTITVAGSECPLHEGCKVWFGVPVEKPNNYKVVKVADSKNGFLVALQEVAKHG